MVDGKAEGFMNLLNGYHDPRGAYPEIGLSQSGVDAKGRKAGLIQSFSVPPRLVLSQLLRPFLANAHLVQVPRWISRPLRGDHAEGTSPARDQIAS